ncbi:type II toxin-antitoxin system VapC family toxin [Stygiolobus caldivivus]|uniref:PIN domain nuclease n=1 Tax=Stygiolobus caldivivus TaxID=2824673 RepID=A0A8D5U3P9_9CREN|nr:type II toxin-antitoxin system VapC family toxin [Stygiolobus caldivivus]BCU68801.1 PIN domain nuclease [Stygiolobus caldivivus]
MIFLDANFLIYLNLGVRGVEEFYYKLLSEENTALDPLVIDEVVYVSKKKYGVKYEDTLEFLDNVVLPYSVVFPITVEEYKRAKDIMLVGLKPSDAFHVAVMLNNSVLRVVSEDADFDKVKGVQRVWLR